MTRSKQWPALRLTLFGTPIRIGLSFPITIVALPLLFGGHLGHDPWLLGTWLALVTVSVLVHESGHVALLRRFGYHPEVSLNALGGLTSTEESGHLGPWRSILVSLAGPGAAIALGITIQAALVPIDARTASWLRDASWLVNIWWSAFNLMPIMPFDGGHVMRELVETSSRRRGASVAWLIALVIALSVTAWLVFGDDYPGLVMIGIILTVGMNIRYFAITARQLKAQSIDIAHEQLIDDELRSGIAVLMPIAMSRETRMIPDEAYTMLAWALLYERRFAELALLDATRFHENHRALLTGATAWYLGDLPHAVTLVADALATGAMDPPDNYFNRVFGRLGELDRLAQRISELHGDASVRAGTRLHQGVLAAATTS